MTIELREEGALIDSVKPGYYGCECGYGCSGGGGCNCTGDTPTPPGPEPPTPDTGITSIHIIVADTITDSGKASVVFLPSTARTSFYFSSSDESIAEIDPDTGEITVIQTGVVTFCVEDLYTGLEDCKEVNVIKSEDPDTGSPFPICVIDTGATGNPISLKVIYNVKSVERETILYAHNSMDWNNITLIEFSDGTSIVPPGGYGGLGHIFNETGDTTVIFTMASNYIGRKMFENVPDIIDVEIFNGFYDGDSIQGTGAFSGCTSLTSITFTSENLWIPSYFCDGCVSLKNITFNSCLYEISSYAFRGCTSLQTIVLPPNIISLDDGAFSGCTSLSSITSYGSTVNPSGRPALASGVFTGVADRGTLHYPSDVDYSFWFRSLPSGWVGDPFNR